MSHRGSCLSQRQFGIGIGIGVAIAIDIEPDCDLDPDTDPDGRLTSLQEQSNFGCLPGRTLAVGHT